MDFLSEFRTMNLETLLPCEGWHVYFGRLILFESKIPLDEKTMIDSIVRFMRTIKICISTQEIGLYSLPKNHFVIILDLDQNLLMHVQSKLHEYFCLDKKQYFYEAEFPLDVNDGWFCTMIDANANNLRELGIDIYITYE
jgi:hypothetical protein